MARKNWLSGGLALGLGLAPLVAWAQSSTGPYLFPTQPLTLTAPGTALSVTNSAEFGTGGTALTLQSGNITSAGIFNFTSNATGFEFYAPTGLGFGIVDPASTITGKFNFVPGTANGPSTLNANGSSSTTQGFEISTLGNNGNLVLYGPQITGTQSSSWVGPGNCGQGSGLSPGRLTICDGGDVGSGSAAPLELLVTKYLGGPNGSPTTSGGRTEAGFFQFLNAPTADTSNAFYQTVEISANASAPAGGVSGTPLGALVSLSIYDILQSGATNFLGVGSQENDLAIETGGSAASLTGISVALLSSNAVAPSVEGIGFAVAAQTGATPTLTFAYSVGTQSGIDPMASTGTILGWDTNNTTAGKQIANGINISHWTFSGNAYNDGHVQLTGAGDSLLNSTTALSTTATAGFVHLPNSAGAPTGTPATISGDACEINTSTETLNCYIGSGWYHIALTSGAG